MATTPNSAITVQQPKLDLIAFSTADAPASVKTLMTGGPNGTKVTALWASNNDSTAHGLTVGIQRGGVPQPFAANQMPAFAGVANAIPAVNMMSTVIWPGLPLDADGNPFIFLQSTLDSIFALYTLTFVAGGSINVAGIRGDF